MATTSATRPEPDPNYVERCKIRVQIAERTIRSHVEADCQKLNRLGTYPGFVPDRPGGPDPGLGPHLDPGRPPPGFERLEDRLRDPNTPPFAPGPGDTPPDKGFLKKRLANFSVGIIGSGMAGLYTAMILDSLDIRWEILEASGRPGGRIYTHRFSCQPGDYYDVGAMRFPNIPAMSRTFDLFQRLDINDDLGAHPAQGTLIPYYLTGPNTPLLYNNVRNVPAGGDPPAPGFYPDTFGVSVANGGTVPNAFVAQGPNAITSPIYAEWRERLSDPMQFEAAWLDLMALDAQSVSVRTQLFTHLRNNPANVNYTNTELYYVTNWCETMGGSTGSYDGSFVSSVIHSLEFNWPVFPDDNLGDPVPAEAGLNVWRCINGGAEHITKGMMERIDTSKISYGLKVTKIQHVGDAIELRGVHHGVAVARTYTHVFNTTTLGCLQTMDTTNAGLDYAHREAIRVLGYAQAVKVGIKFKKRWWVDESGINTGGQGKTDRPTRVVVYPSYALDTVEGTPGVLLACYNSAQDAARLGSLFPNPSTMLPEHVYEYVIADLAVMHNYPEDELRKLTISYHAYSWHNDPLTRGAWGAFGPGQYSTFFGRIQRPQAQGHLFFSGEATSIYPGWVVGSLNSAYRSVRQMILCELYRAILAGDWAMVDFLLQCLFILAFYWGANQFEPQPELAEDILGLEGWQVYLGIIGAEAGL